MSCDDRPAVSEDGLKVQVAGRTAAAAGGGEFVAQFVGGDEDRVGGPAEEILETTGANLPPLTGLLVLDEQNTAPRSSGTAVVALAGPDCVVGDVLFDARQVTDHGAVADLVDRGQEPPVG